MRQIRKITSLILTFCFLFSSLEKARAEDIIASNLNQPSYEEILPEEKESDPSGEPVLEPTPSPEPETEAVSTEEIQFGAIETPADEIPADILPLVLDMEHFNDFSKEDQDKLWAYLTRFGPQASEEDILAMQEKVAAYKANRTPAMEALDICASNPTISDCSEEELLTLCDFFGVSVDSLNRFADQSALEVYRIYEIVNGYGFSTQEAESVIETYPNLSDRILELDQFARFKEYSGMDTEAADTYFLSGYNTDEIESAYLKEYLFATPIQSAICHFEEANSSEWNANSAVSLTLNGSATQSEFLRETLTKYHLSLSASPSGVQTFGVQEGETLEEKLLAYERTKAAALSSGAEAISNAKNDFVAPYQISNSNQESISLNTGALDFRNTLLNNSLKLRYNSVEADLRGMDLGYSSYSNYAVIYSSVTTYSYPASHTRPGGTNLLSGNATITLEPCSSYQQMLNCYNQYNGTTESISNPDYDASPLVGGTFYETMTNNVTNYWDAQGNLIRTVQQQHPISGLDSIPSGSYYENTNRYGGYMGIMDRGATTAQEYTRVYNSDGSSSQLTVYTANFSGELYYCPPTLEKSYSAEMLMDSYEEAYNTTTQTTYGEKSSNLGSGWQWDLPSIEINEYKILHLSGGVSYRINSDLSLKNYSLKDMQLSEDTTYTAGQVASKYMLKYKDGSKIYFAADGRLLAEIDRYGNTVSYEHTTINGFPVVNKITDPYGRVTSIAYADTDGGRTVTITNPDATTSVITLSAVPNQTGEYVITKITDPIGRETTFQYDYPSRAFSYLDKSSRSSSVLCANLIQVTYPTGATTQYTYESVTENLGESGSCVAYRIKTREDKIGTDSYNKKTYTYTNNPTGYPSHSNPNSLPSSFTYQVSVTDEAGLKQEYTFNNKHLNITTKVYDTSATTEKLLSQTDNTFNSDKLLESRTSTTYNQTDNTSLSATESYTYDSGHYGDILTYTDPYNSVTTYTYESNFHQVTSKVTPVNNTLSRTITYTIDSATGNLTKMVDGDLTVEYLYDSRGNVTKETAKDTVNNKTTVTNYEYSALYQGAFLTKQSTSVTDYTGVAQTMEESYEYDFSKGLLTKTIHPNGSFTTYTYDTIGRQTATTPPQLGDTLTSTLTEYDDVNQITTVTDETGYKVRVKFDELGREIQKEEFIDNAWRALEIRAYNDLSQVISITNALNATTQYEYDIQGRITKTTHPDNSFVTAAYYDGEGKTVTTSEDGAVNRSFTDLLGRTVKTEAVNGNTTATTLYEYDKAGNNSKITDPKGNVTTNTYDAKSRLVKTSNTVDGEAVETVYAYDAFSNLTKVTDPMGNDTQSVYDELGRVIQNTDSLGKTEKTKYDVTGNPMETVARSGITTTYEYNPRGWLTKSTTGSIVTEMDYDKAGRVTQKTRGEDSRLYEYYANGQLKKETAEDGKSIQYVYDVLGRRTQMTDYFGQVFTYSYNNRDYLTGVSGLGKSVSYTRNTDGTVATKSLGNLTHSYSYDSLNQLTGLTHTANSNTLQSYSYTYDLNGNQLTKNRTKDSSTTTETYTYDVLNRVKTVSAGGSTTTYSYDKNGNILSESTGSGNSSSYTYDLNNRLTHKSVGTSFWDFSYDHDGNLIYKAQGTTASGEEQETPAIFVLGTDTLETFGDTATYQYNELGQLVQYLDLNGQTVTYTYDLNGLRSSKTVGGVTTKYYYDGDLVVNETDGTNLKATNLNGIQTEIRFTHEGETVTAAYFVYDGHGDVMSVLNETLDEIANYEYDIYGEEKSSTGVYDSPIRYTGQYYDAETGMYYLRARYYDPSIRRFISEDPAHDGRNWYAYCNGNPIKYWDPSGCTWERFDQYLPQSAQDEIAYLTEQYFLVGEAKNAQGVYLKHILHSKAINVRNRYLDMEYLRLATIDFADAGITESNFMYYGYEDTYTYTQLLYEHAIILQDMANHNASMPRDKGGHISKTFLKMADFLGYLTVPTPNLRKVSNSEANEIAKKYGFSSAEDFKESIVGKSNISKYNIKVEKKTGEIFLESVQKGGAVVETGYYR